MKKWLLALAAIFLSPLLAAQEIMFQPGHVRPILAFQFSPDDSQLISFSGSDQSEDDRLCLWEVKTGRLLWMTATGFVQDRYEYASLVEFHWSDDGRVLVTKSKNGTYQVWDAKTGKIISQGKAEPDIKLLMQPGTGARELAQRPETRGFREDVRLSNARTMQAETDSGREGSVRITDIPTGRSWWLEAHPGVIRDLAYNPDGSVLAAAGADGAIYVFAAAPRALTRTLVGHTRPVIFLAFTPDGRSLLTCAVGMETKLWDWKTGTILSEANLGTETLDKPKVALSSDGKTFFVAGEDNGKQIGLWETASLKPIRKLRVKERYESTAGNMTLGYDSMPVIDAVFGRDGDQIVAAYRDGSLRIWDAFRGKQLKQFQVGKRVSQLLPGLDDQTIIMITELQDAQRVVLFDLKMRKEVTSLGGWETHHIKEFALSRDGRFMAASHDESAVLIGPWKDRRQIHRLEVGRSGFDALAFSPDGKTLAVGGENQNVLIFDTEKGTKLWQLLPFYQPSELEAQLARGREERHAALDEALARRDKQAAADTEEYRKKVRVGFDHYGVMVDPMDLRLAETREPNKSKIVVSAKDANAVWLRLYNDSPLPVELDAHSYVLTAKCVHEFSPDNLLYGLCPGSEVSFDLHVKDKRGKTLPRVIDFFFTVYVLPNTSVLFAAPKRLLDEGALLTLYYTFHNAIEEHSYWGLTEKHADYGTKKALEFRIRDLLKPK